MNIRAILGWGMMIALAAAIATAAFQGGRASRLSARVDRFEACEAAVAGRPKARPAAEVCSKTIAEADALADRERACSAALAAENTFAIRMTCGAPTKALFAQRDAARSDLQVRTEELTNERLGRAGDLRRAQAAGRAEAGRKARRDAAVEAAPRDDGGLVVCDDGCLRSRW